MSYDDARKEVANAIEQCRESQKLKKQQEKENKKSVKENFKDEFMKLKNG